MPHIPSRAIAPSDNRRSARLPGRSLRVRIPSWAFRQSSRPSSTDEATSTTTTSRPVNVSPTENASTNATQTGTARQDVGNDEADEEQRLLCARAVVLRDGVLIPAVQLDGPSTVRRGHSYPEYDTRAVCDAGAQIHTVNGSGRKYFRRGERAFVTLKELAPCGSKKYARANRTGRKVIMKTIRKSTVPFIVYAAYQQVIASFAKVLLHPGLHGTGLFSGEDIQEQRFVMEYTGNRINRKKSVVMQRSLDRLDMSPDVFVHVQKGKGTLDPRGCGNAAMCINHSCDPNAELYEMDLGTKTIIVIRALKAIKAGEEITCDYGYNSLLSNLVLICECGSSKCGLAV